MSGISLAVQPGELVGIMGPSGSGKSTLLSTIVGDRAPTEGRVSVAGIDPHTRFDELRGQIASVPQDDIMHPELTVGQALWYSARLRLPRDYSDAEIGERIATVIAELGLEGSEHTRIGSADRRGISGGQRRRVNVAMELLTDPPMLVLDEPTSGLSSVDALSLIRLLRKMADGGKTIVLTIHQPSLEILKLLNAVAVLARDESTNQCGSRVWYGPPLPHAIEFFEPQTGSVRTTADADAMLRGLATRPVDDWRRAYHQTDAYRHWVVNRLSRSSPSSLLSSPPGWSLLDAMTQCIVLAHRMLAVKVADGWNTAILLAQAPLIAMLIAGVFGAKCRGSLSEASWAGVSSALSTTTFLLALAAIWFGCSNAAREIVGERAIYRRERMVGLTPIAYLSSKVIVLGLLCLVQCMVLLVICGLGCGLSGSWAVALVVMMLSASVGTAIGLCISAASRTTEAAAAALPLVVLPLVVLGGILVPMADLPSVTSLLSDFMPSRWAFEALLVNEADARPLLRQLVPTDNGVVPLEIDVAENWFPTDGWRCRSTTPVLVLFVMWLIGVQFTYLLLSRKEA